MTPSQHQLLSFIKFYIDEHGYAPSFEEIAGALGHTSKSHIHKKLKALEEQGFIRRLRYRARAIEVVENPVMPLDLSNISQSDMAQEARRRGLHLGHWFPTTGSFIPVH